MFKDLPVGYLCIYDDCWYYVEHELNIGFPIAQGRTEAEAIINFWKVQE